MNIMFYMGIIVLRLSRVVGLRICFLMEISRSDGVFYPPLRCSVPEVPPPLAPRPLVWCMGLMIERTGEYVAHDDHIPIDGSGDLFKDKLLGISIADFAIAIVDEAETEAHVFQHWTVTG